MHIPSTGLLQAAGVTIAEHEMGRACYSCAPDGCTLLATAREIVTEYLYAIAAARSHLSAATPIHPLPSGGSMRRQRSQGRPHPTTGRLYERLEQQAAVQRIIASLVCSHPHGPARPAQQQPRRTDER